MYTLTNKEFIIPRIRFVTGSVELTELLEWLICFCVCLTNPLSKRTFAVCYPSFLYEKFSR